MENRKVKHIRNFGKVRKMIIAHYDELQKKYERSLANARDCLERIRKGEKEVKLNEDSSLTMSEQGCVNLISRLEANLLPPYRGKPRKGTVFWYLQGALDRLDAADKAPVFTGLKVKIEWEKSRTWGSNPSAECWVIGNGPAIYTIEGEDGKPLTNNNGTPYLNTTHYKVGHASGCGYDKRSAAIEYGILCPTIDRLIIENAKTWKFYAVEGKDYFPHLSISGKGVETLRNLFVGGYKEKPPIPGFEWTWEEGKTWDFIEVKPKAKRSS